DPHAIEKHVTPEPFGLDLERLGTHATAEIGAKTPRIEPITGNRQITIHRRANLPSMVGQLTGRRWIEHVRLVPAPTFRDVTARQRIGSF
ncbi:MAG: hypothetical protein ABUS79_13000, partial [Pseudomonadota bacterium]